MTHNVFSGTLNPAESKLSAYASPQPKWHLNRFSRLCTDDRGVSLLFTIACLFPFKIAPSHVGISTSCNTWFIGPTRVQNANGNLIVTPFLQGSLVWHTDRATQRPTDWPRYSVRCGVIMRNYVGYDKVNNFATINLLSRHVYVQNI